MSEPLRVLHLVPSLGEGGAQRQLALLVRFTDRSRVEHSVACWEEGAFAAEVRAAGAPILALPRPSPRLLPALVRTVRRARPHVVQTWLWSMDILGAIAGRLASHAAVISGERNSRAKYAAEPRSARLALRNACRRRLAHGVIANSQGGLEYLREDVGIRAPVWVIRNGLDVEALDAAAPADLGPRSRGPRALAVGRLHPQKNLPALLRGVALAAPRVPGLELLVCGEGAERGRLEVLARELGIAERVRWLGFRADVWSVMKACDLFVHAALTEGYPNAVLEAAAAGTPLCVSDIPPHREVPDLDAIAVLFDPRAPESIARAIGAALAADPAERAARVARARAVAEQHSARGMATRFEEVYRLMARERLCYGYGR